MTLTKTKSTPLVFILLFISAFSSNIEKSASIATTPSFEKLYLHFDKPYYYAGEDIWFKVYLVDAKTNKSDTLSKVVYVDLINPDNKIVDSKTIKINEDGGSGDFSLSVNLINGEYMVRAYTNYMRNFDNAYFFRKKIYIHSLYLEENTNNEPQSKEFIDEKANSTNIDFIPDVQFFPEGGYLVNSLPCRVGFKAVEVDGKGIDVSGIIIDNTGKEIQKIKSLKFGLGRFQFLPEDGRKYFAKITYNNIQNVYDLPTPLTKGVVMEVEELMDSYNISVMSSLPNGVDNLKFIGIQRGLVVCGTEIIGDKVKVKIIVPKSYLKQGIIQFTLFDNNDTPLCERLVFLESNEPNPKIAISPSKATYGKRSLVELEISCEQAIQQKINTNMSIAVTDLSTVEPDNYGLDLKSYLLLNSELKGEIEHPNYYFESEEPQRKGMLDVLMMTQGWRQFIWNKHSNNNGNELKFDYETGISISGNVKRVFNHKKSAVAEVFIALVNNDKIRYDLAKTNAEGHFEFKALDFFDSTTVIIQAKKIKKNATRKNKLKNPAMNYFIEMDSFVAPMISIKKNYSKSSDRTFDKGYLEKLNEKHYYDPINADMNDRIKLKEVKLETIISRRKKQRGEKRGIYNNPSNTLDFEDVKTVPVYHPLLALRGRFAGVQVGTKLGGIYISIRGQGTPMFLVDGMPMSAADGIPYIPFSDIDFVDVLKGPEAAIYGIRARNGVIAVYTLDGSDREMKAETRERNGIINFKHPGYYQARKFYEPNYKIKKQLHDKLDDRTTIYWNPIAKLNEQGKTKISFFSTDISTTYRVDIQGLTSEGGILTSEMFFDIKD